MPFESITIRGARQHNLKNIDLTLPRNRFIVITGVSGSGKSSLAFDTLFAEGQRRYMEALSTFARQLLQSLDAPKVDAIEGLSPAIAIEQKGLPSSPRSTVGTLTEIHDHLRLLFSRLGRVICPTCGTPIVARSVPEMLRELLAEWPEGSRMLLLAPLGTIGENEVPALLKRLRRDGFARIRVDGRIYELEPLPHLARRPGYTVEVVVDRLVLDPSREVRLLDSLELTAKLGEGVVRVLRTDGAELVFNEHYRCITCGFEAPALSPSLFSFHHPAGMCPTCKGRGFLDDHPQSGLRKRPAPTPADEDSAVELSALLCPDCAGSRLNATARSVQFAGLSIDAVSRLPVAALEHWIATLLLTPSEAAIAEQPIAEIRRRLQSLTTLGLSYLTLDRSAPTLSGGEVQRLRLAHQVSAPMAGVLYVLDEPSIGLHPRDHHRLLEILFALRDAGNTVVVVEHDRETILAADHVVDIGPGAGTHGGDVLYSGPPAGLLQSPRSLTGQYLSGVRCIPIPSRRRACSQGTLAIVGVRGHNLQQITAHFPLGCLTCVTGVSGSGKSTLVMHTLYRVLAQHLYGALRLPEPFERIENLEAIDKVILVDQAPLGRTPRSTPATYSGVFDLIRALFADLPEARARGYSANRFSFNVKGGRCEACKGEGFQRIDMVFLPDVFVRCPVCQGSRFHHSALEIRFKGHSIAEVLEMTVFEAAALFENLPAIRLKLQTLIEVGLGYLTLGQPANTLSGGEAQRVKLATELSRKASGKTLYILDEPTTGLHFDDIEKLMHLLQRLVDQGHTVICIEHNPDVIKTADYVIDLGPEGGEEGGEIVAEGSPEAVAQVAASYTGAVLREALAAPQGQL